MKKTKIMFFFDTEDFTDPDTADSVKVFADMCRSENITGHFSIVGLMAKFLSENRHDIVESLNEHIIGSHTLTHGIHPNIMEISDKKSFEEAYSNVEKEESECIGILKSVFKGKEISYFTAPGNSKSYVAMYYYTDRSVPYWCDSITYDEKNIPIELCGIENLTYKYSFEEMYRQRGKLSNKDILDRLSDKDTVIVFGHPHMAISSEYWDVLNYDKKNDCEFGKWKKAKKRSPEDIEYFYDMARSFMKEAKADPRFEVTDLNKLYSERNEAVPIKRSDLPFIEKSLSENFTYIGNYSVYDVFSSLCAFARNEDEYIPSSVYGFLEEPFSCEDGVTLKKEDVLDVARRFKGGFIPPYFEVGNKKIGPADLLFALFDALIYEKDHTVGKKEQKVSLDNYPGIMDFHPKGTWRHSESFRDGYLSDRLRLQGWTLRKPFKK